MCDRAEKGKKLHQQKSINTRNWYILNKSNSPPVESVLCDAVLCQSQWRKVISEAWRRQRRWRKVTVQKCLRHQFLLFQHDLLQDLRFDEGVGGESSKNTHLLIVNNYDRKELEASYQWWRRNLVNPRAALKTQFLCLWKISTQLVLRFSWNEKKRRNLSEDFEKKSFFRRV